MSTPTSVDTGELAASTLKGQVKIEKMVVVDVVVEEVDAKRGKAGGSLKREEIPPPSDFCRLCYCRFDLFSKL